MNEINSITKVCWQNPYTNEVDPIPELGELKAQALLGHVPVTLRGEQGLMAAGLDAIV